MERLENRRLLALVAAEGFATADYAPGSGLAGANPFSAAFDGAWTSNAGTATVSSGNLTYTGFGNGGTNRVQLGGTTTAVLWRALLEGNNGPLGSFMDGAYNVGASAGGGALYFSFLMKVDGSSPPVSTMSLYKDGVTSADRQFRINYTATSYQAVVGTAPAVNLLAANANTNLFVIKIQFAAGNDTISVFQNPTVGAAEPSPTAQITGFNLSFDRIGLTRAAGTGTTQFDELRFGTSWADVTQSAALATLPAPQTIVAMQGLPPSPLGDGTYPYGFFPFVDRFGQYRHLDWTDKIHSAAELAQSAIDETADLAANPGPADWNVYGGWEAGPQLSATGYFRVQKYQGKWWLVDPAGRLFFSNGVDGVSDPKRQNNATTAVKTGVTDRINYFADFPGPSDPANQFFAYETSFVTSGYYGGTKPLAINYTAINAYDKYGANWQSITHSLAHQRLRSWGMNTIGGWSDENVYLESQTPYTIVLFPNNPSFINDNTTFPDYYDPMYYNNVVSRVSAEAGASLNDPYLIGYFIYNELDWAKSNVTSTAVGMATLAAAATQPAKIVFRDQLLAKYGTIVAMNAQWQTSYTSWTDFLNQRGVVPNAAGAQQDLNDFELAYSIKHYSATRQAMRQAAPNHLYLGSRFTSGVHAPNVQAAAAYADVVSINRYGTTINLPAAFNGIDAPILSSEYGFNATDTGLFGDDVTNADDQAERVSQFQSYVESALADSRYVGVHWFQYWDYPTAGRLGGEGNNSQLGILTVTTTPYSQTVAAARTEGARIYEGHLGSFALLDEAGVLHLAGTPSADQISISISGANLLVTRGTTMLTFMASSVLSIRISAGYADDTINVAAGVTIPISFHGGLSSETLTVAGAAEAVNSQSASIPGTLDLTDHDLVINYAGATPFGSIFNQIAGGNVTTSAGGAAMDLALAEAADVLALAANQTAMFSGVTVDASSLLIRYTVGGDANLDGRLDADDYFRIDSNYAKSGTTFGYWNGDFDYNGLIDADDYFILDSNMSTQPAAPAAMHVTQGPVLPLRREMELVQDDELPAGLL